MKQKLILIIIVVALVASGYFFVKTKVLVPLATNTNVFSDSTNYASGGWKMHQSAKHQYQFYYPNTWSFHPYQEENPEVQIGAHSLSNYNMNAVENFMDHGIVDWQAMLGDRAAIKVDITVTNITPDGQAPFEQSIIDTSKQNTLSGEAKKQEKSDLTIGNYETTLYEYDDPETLKFLYFAYPNGTKLVTIGGFVTNTTKEKARDNQEWATFKQVLASFNFIQ